jgi:hypothetical protein
MSQNPAGVLAIRDELTGWWSTLDRAGREGERAFCLQAWNGDTGHTIDRIGRGTIHVEACCMSMLGGIQPARLRSYLVDAIEDGPANDGLIQRFQVLVWPDTEPEWKYVDRPPDCESQERVAGIFRTLVELDSENAKLFRFAPEAQDLFVDWLKELEEKVRGNELHPALISHLSKYRKLMPALSLLFELAAQSAGVGEGGTVSLGHARMAAAWCDYRDYPYDASMKNLAKARSSPRYHPPRPWRSREESQMIRQYAFWWFTCRDRSKPSARSWAKQLGVSHTWLQKLVKEFKTNPTKINAEMRSSGDPTTDRLEAARTRTREMKEAGELRLSPREQRELRQKKWAKFLERYPNFEHS